MKENFGEFCGRMLSMCDDSATRKQIIQIWAERNRERARSEMIDRWVIRVAFTLMGGSILAMIVLPFIAA